MLRSLSPRCAFRSGRWLHRFARSALAAAGALAAPAARADSLKLRIGVLGYGVGGHLSAGVSWMTWVAETHLLKREFAAEGIGVQWVFLKGLGPKRTGAEQDCRGDDVLGATLLVGFASLLVTVAGDRLEAFATRWRDRDR